MKLKAETKESEKKKNLYSKGLKLKDHSCRHSDNMGWMCLHTVLESIGLQTQKWKHVWTIEVDGQDRLFCGYLRKYRYCAWKRTARYTIWGKVCGHLTITPIWAWWPFHFKTIGISMELSLFPCSYSSLHFPFHKILKWVWKLVPNSAKGAFILLDAGQHLN